MSILPGGPKIDYSKIDPKSLREGTAHEMEHTSDFRIAREIAAEHLQEDPNYYKAMIQWIEKHGSSPVKENPAFQIRLTNEEYTLLKRAYEGHGFWSGHPVMRLLERSRKVGSLHVFDVPLAAQGNWHYGVNYVEELVRELEQLQSNLQDGYSSLIIEGIIERASALQKRMTRAGAPAGRFENPRENPPRKGRGQWDTQSILFPRDTYTLAQAKDFLIRHGYKTSWRGKGPDTTENYYRFRQGDPEGFGGYRTIEIGKGIKLVRGIRRNPSENPEEQCPEVEIAYAKFHGVPPDSAIKKTLWVPGPVVDIGKGIDTGYGIVDRRSQKDGLYVHEFSAGVRVYRRAKPGETPDKVWNDFPEEMFILGDGLGITYEDSEGVKHEIKGTRGQKLCVDDSKKILALVGSQGVEYVITGGNMHVEEWIYE